MDINFITVCTDQYPMVYAEKITNRMRDITNLELHFFCLTDRPHEVSGWAKPLAIPAPSQGWWNKVSLFSPDMPSGWLLYMDIDIVINANFDDEILATIALNKDVSCVSDAIEWMGEKFSSSFMLLKSGACTHVFDDFVNNKEHLTDREGGDQVWVGPKLSDINYIDEHFPNLKKNLKFDLGVRIGNRLTLPKHIPDYIKLVDCGGRPKPHELTMLPYIKQNWHNVHPVIDSG